MKSVGTMLSVFWMILWWVSATPLQGQVLWGKAKVGMTPQEIAVLEPNARPMIELKKLAGGTVAKLCLPGVTVAGLTVIFLRKRGHGKLG